MSIHLVHPYALLGIPLSIAALVWHLNFSKKPVYLFSSLTAFKDITSHSIKLREYTLLALQTAALIGLSLAIAQIQTPDEKTLISSEGVDIMLVLDISGSMQLFDDLQDKRTRFEVAQTAALKFIDARENDPIGLVIFANDVVSRCPLTLDKKILKELLAQTHLGLIDYQGTLLSQAIITAANRLKLSSAATKIMIVLTDGSPTENDLDPQLAIDLAKKLGIKIYTIGVGSEQGGFISHPIWGLQRNPTNLNLGLLRRFADETGGEFFLARTPKDVEAVYQTIDKLEKTEHQTPLYARYYDYFIYFLIISALCLGALIILSTLFWRSL